MQESILSHYVCKIEGHGDLKLNFKSGKASLLIDEGERVFERIVLGRPYEDAPFITARICGVCPTAHVLTSIAAIEDALKVKVNDRIMALRLALNAGQIIQSHALHLFFLAAPDYLGVTNALELHEKNPAAFDTAVKLKKLGDKVVEVIGGRAVHPVSPVVGGFLSVPENDELKKLMSELSAAIPMALETVEIFSSFEYPKLKRKTEYLTSVKDNRIVYVGSDEIISDGKFRTSLENYGYAYSEVLREGATTKYGVRDGHGFMIGALARLSIDHENLNPKALYAYREIWGKEFPTYNSFHNNVAQAIEMLHLLEEAVKQLQLAIDHSKELARVPYTVFESAGVGVVEAPRGCLYHSVKLDKNGIIKSYDIVTPTVQNLVNLEEDADELMATRGKKSEAEMYREIEMLIRAYDPCITCAVH
jgi:sulfhydrogenase subunit alpha